MNADRLVYLERYLDRCWQARQYYKDETSKLLYWAGTLFVGIVGATGIFGANQSNKFLFQAQHIIIFHAAFTVAWLYYLYKQLNADMFERLGKLIEAYLRRSKGLNKDWEFESFFGLKGHYLGKPVGHGRSLTRFANVILVGIYLAVTGAPIFEGGVSTTSVSVNFKFLFTTGMFPFLLFAAWHLYRRERKRVLSEIEKDWKEYIPYADQPTNASLQQEAASCSED